MVLSRVFFGSQFVNVMPVMTCAALPFFYCLLFYLFARRHPCPLHVYCSMLYSLTHSLYGVCVCVCVSASFGRTYLFINYECRVNGFAIDKPIFRCVFFSMLFTHIILDYLLFYYKNPIGRQATQIYK